MMPSPCAYRRERNSNHQHPMFVVLCLRHRIVTITPVAILCPSTTDAQKIIGARIPDTTAESNMPTKSVKDMAIQLTEVWILGCSASLAQQIAWMSIIAEPAFVLVGRKD